METVYSAAGVPQAIRNAASGLQYWQALAADARGNVTLSRLGNGVEETRSFEAATGFLTGIFSQGPAANPAPSRTSPTPSTGSATCSAARTSAPGSTRRSPTTP